MAREMRPQYYNPFLLLEGDLLAIAEYKGKPFWGIAVVGDFPSLIPVTHRILSDLHRKAHSDKLALRCWKKLRFRLTFV